MFLRKIVYRIYALALAAGAGLHAAPAAACTNASLRGDYAFTASGTTFPSLGLPAPLTGAFMSSGSATFDGRGNFTVTATSSFNGVLQGPATVTGTYSVDPDCTYTSQASNGATFRAAIVAGGRELYILQTNPGTAIVGTAIARDARPHDDDDDAGTANGAACTATSLVGSYGFIANGFAGAPSIPGPFSPLVGVGVVTVNRNGTFTMMAQRSVGGVLDPVVLPLTGTYQLGPGCTYTLTFDVGFHFTGTIVNRNETVFIETDLGTAITVTSTRL